MAILVIFLCETILIVFFLYLFWSIQFSAPFYPSSKRQLNEALEKLNIHLQGEFIDLGSGDGRIARYATTLGLNATGVEQNPFLSLYSRFTNVFKSQKVKYLNRDLFKIDYSSYDIVYLYLYPKLMDKLEPTLFTQMKKNSLIISNTFTFKNTKPWKEYNRIKIYKV